MEKARNVEESSGETLLATSTQQEKLPDATYSKVDSFCRKARWPLAHYLLIIGIPASRPSFVISTYNKLVILLLILVCLRKWTQIGRAPDTPYLSIQESVFDPNVILTFCRFIFVFGGLVTLSSLQAIDRRRRLFLEAVDVAIDPENAPFFMKKLNKVVRHLLLFSISMTFVSCFFETSFRAKLFGMNLNWAKPLIGPSLLYLPIELYLCVICETSITMMSIDFCVSCTILRYLVVDVCIHMRKNFKDSPTLVKLHHLDEIQSHHFGLIMAKKCLEDCYAFAVFIFYSIAVPCCCIMAYIAYRNNDNNTVVMSSMLMWITNVIVLLLILSIPAFQLGEDLLTSAFEMYQRCLKGEDDARITTQFAILTNQIQSHPMIISAYNYFPMNRAMLLSMFSVIFTYFLILVQFSEEGKEIQSVLDLLKNGSSVV